MENQRNSKAPKPKSSDGFDSPINSNLSNFVGAPPYRPTSYPYPSGSSNFVGAPPYSPINPYAPGSSNFVGARPYGQTLNPYACGSSNSFYPLVNYPHSADPAAAAASSTVYPTPVKNEDGVFVLDAINVGNSIRGGGELGHRFSRPPSEYGTGYYTGSRSNSTTPSSSAPPGRISEIGICKYKTAMCRSWETSGACQFGPYCQYAHSIEELRPPRLPGRMSLEAPIFNPYTSSEGSISSSSGTKYQFNLAAPEFSPSQQTQTAVPTTPIQGTQPSESTVVSSSTIPSINPPTSDWIPQDDGIEFPLPSSMENPTREDVIAYMRARFGNKSRKRLPVFKDIAPE